MQEQGQGVSRQLDRVWLTPVHGAGQVDEEDELGRVNVKALLGVFATLINIVVRLRRKRVNDASLNTACLLPSGDLLRYFLLHGFNQVLIPGDQRQIIEHN